MWNSHYESLFMVRRPVVALSHNHYILGLLMVLSVELYLIICIAHPHTKTSFIPDSRVALVISYSSCCHLSIISSFNDWILFYLYLNAITEAIAARAAQCPVTCYMTPWSRVGHVTRALRCRSPAVAAAESRFATASLSTFGINCSRYKVFVWYL